MVTQAETLKEEFLLCNRICVYTLAMKIFLVLCILVQIVSFLMGNYSGILFITSYIAHSTIISCASLVIKERKIEHEGKTLMMAGKVVVLSQAFVLIGSIIYTEHMNEVVSVIQLLTLVSLALISLIIASYKLTVRVLLFLNLSMAVTFTVAQFMVVVTDMGNLVEYLLPKSLVLHIVLGLFSFLVSTLVILHSKSKARKGET